MQEASRALEIGQSVLLPPVLDRMDLLLAALPENPSDFASLTAGQVYTYNGCAPLKKQFNTSTARKSVCKPLFLYV